MEVINGYLNFIILWSVYSCIENLLFVLKLEYGFLKLSYIDKRFVYIVYMILY